MLEIMACDEQKSEAYVIEVPEDKTREVLRVFNGDLARLVESIDIIDKKLVISKPKV